MLPKYTPDDLISFENEVANIFNKGEIVRLSICIPIMKNMIEIFKDVKAQDWVFCLAFTLTSACLKGCLKKLC